ncbi:arginase [Flavobacteriaceae bacterium]|nr:arginase [Flavobacteriaceae bacterium]
MKPITIIKNRSDIGAGTRGSDLGIDAIEIAAINQHNGFFNEHAFVDVPSHNETIYNKKFFEMKHRLGFVLEQCQRVCNSVSEILKQNQFPLILSGDHSSAFGSLAGIQKAHPDKTIGVLWIDAHADLHTPLSTPSGNVHGMPLAAALGFNNENLAVNKMNQETLSLWENLKKVGGETPKVVPKHLVYFGVRNTEEPEDKVIKQNNIKNYPVHEIRHRGLELCVNETLERLSEVDMIYISFDVDSMDCDLISKGTGTPVPKGFDIDEIVAIIGQVMESQKVVSLEVTEVNPLLDNKGNRMAEAAFEVIQRLFQKK